VVRGEHGRQVACPVRGLSPRRAARRGPSGPSPDDQGGVGRRRDRGDAGVHTGQRDPLDAGQDAQRTGLSKTTIGKIWKDFGLKAHRVDHFKLSTDPLFIDKLYDVVGLYLNPPEAAVVACVDERSQVQALQRSQPAFPMMPGMPERRTHDYVRNGTTTLFAAMNVADRTVCLSLHWRHRAIEFKKFLAKIDDRSPKGSIST
jgi:hypothetical protein